eukprot:TRINITY_DN14980_c0_g1_i9.p1 TRINITY_DN14980_c0_g1~~TRINITY_DN14980_c0_g1_i9.p1  ORF type:complete len:145 (-),score=16.86 TRINITY_DN14980_c0_g1_i9:372-761(-)
MYGFKMIDFCKTVNAVILNGCCGSDAGIGKCTCKDVSVVDYAIVSPDLITSVDDFKVLEFCELFSDVHCPIALKLNVNSPLEEKAQLDDVRNCTNINNIKHTNTNGTNPAQGKPKWRKDKESDFVDALD